MNNEQHRKMLISQFTDLASILHRKSLGDKIPTVDEIEDFSDSDLSQWIKQMKEIARTPDD
jgi:hypothetical protein